MSQSRLTAWAGAAETTTAADVATAGSTTVPAHVIYDIVRKLPENAKVELDHPGGDAQLTLRAGRFDTKLAVLPVEQRVAVVLVDIRGYPVAEVATILGVPPGTVKSRCARGRAKLAVALGHLRSGSAETGGNRGAAHDVPSTSGPARDRRGGDR